MIKKKLSLVMIMLIMFLFSPTLGNAENIVEENWNVEASTCYDNSIGLYGTAAFNTEPNPNCTENLSPDTYDVGGIVKCAQEYQRVELDAKRSYEVDGGKRTVVEQYFVARMDAWSANGNPNSWKIIGEMGGNKICPGMYLKYNVSTKPTIISDYEEQKNFRLEGVGAWTPTDESAKATFISDNKNWDGVSDWLSQWGIPNLKAYNGWLDDNNHLIYTIEIPELKTYIGAVNGLLGYNGRTWKHSPSTQGYHYYIPIKIVVSYENEEYDPCKDQAYAYAHPEECCACDRPGEKIYYPEACCGSECWIDSIWYDSRWDMPTLCCSDAEEVDYSGGTLTSLKTFKYYSQQNKRLEFFREYIRDFAERNCPKCSWEVDSSDPNHCCNTEEYKNDKRCQQEDFKCGNPGDKSFSEKLTFCCAETEATMKNNKKWKELCTNEKLPQISTDKNLSCKNLPYKMENAYTSNGIAVKDSITINVSNSHIPIKTVNAGQGFEYNLIINNVTEVTGNGPDGTYYSYSELFDEVRNYNNNFSTIVSNINRNKNSKFNNQNIKFSVNETYKFNYDITSANITPKDLSLNSKNKTFYYYELVCNMYDCWYEKRSATFPIYYQAKAQNNYTVKPYMYYIDIKNKDEGVYASSSKNYENNNNYVRGGRLVYTKSTDKSGIYPFKITIQNGGLTGTINATGDNAFTCEYKVLNCIRDDDCKKETEESYYFRPISLNTPFPNNRLETGKVGSNWLGNAANTSKSKVEKYITDSGDNVYGTIMYRIKLDSETIRMIKSYNKTQSSGNGKGYLDWSNMIGTKFNEFYRRSSLLECLANGENCSSGLKKLDANSITIPNNTERERRIGDFTYPNKTYN